MKKIAFFLLFGLSLSACVREEGCDQICTADLRLVFTFEENQTKFDYNIKNDVHLHIYREDAFYSSLVIPYDAISNGKAYRMAKDYLGNVDFVAWAVPFDDDDRNRIPGCSQEELRSGKIVSMNLDPDLYCQSMGSLFLGAQNYYENDLTSESVCEFKMQNIICNITVSILGYADPSAVQVPDRVEVSGFKQEMTLDKTPGGDDGIIASELTYMAIDKALRSDVMGVMASTEDQYLRFTAFSGNTPVFTVVTEQRSIPGYIIDLVVDRSGGVDLYVNGWRNKGAIVEWM